MMNSRLIGYCTLTLILLGAVLSASCGVESSQLPPSATRAGAVDTELAAVWLPDIAKPMEAFFSAVMGKCEAPAMRAARLSLLHRLRQSFLRVADFSLWQ